jgi:DNA-binding CsgD family transcriptional regulator
MSEEKLSHLIGGIYDAALEPELWPHALEGICGFVGGSMANIFWQDVVAKTAKRFFEWGNDPHYTQLYMETYAKLNPMFPTAYFNSVGQVFSQSDVIAFDDLRETRIYNEWMKPQGYIDFMACLLEKSATSCVPTTVIRHERDGPIDGKSISRMTLIVPHVRRAALIGNVISLRTCAAETFADTLDGLAAGMFLVDQTGHIMHVNLSGLAMLDERIVLRNSGGRLAAIENDANQLLKDVFAAADGGDTAIGKKGVAVSLKTPDGERYVAHVLPLTAGARRRTGKAFAAVAAVFVQKAAVDTPSGTEALANAYDLTAMELRVLLGIVQVGRGPLVAQDLGISETTMRTHLKHVFEKTGTNRQTDLAKLVTKFESPFVDATKST